MTGQADMAGRVIPEARSWIGTPYRHQASARGIGCDCLGLIRGVWRALHGCDPEALPGYTSDWGESGGGEPMLEAAARHFIELEQPEAGCLLVFRWRVMMTAKHAGIYTGNGRFIHAYEGCGVVETNLGSHWRKRIAGSFRFPETRLD